jgi:ribosomal protein L10
MTPTIYKAEGSQIYTWNKMRFLKEKGWDVYVLSSSTNGIIMINDLSVFEKYIIPEISFYPYLYTRKKRKIVLNKLIQAIKAEQSAEYIIETHTKQLSLWGELLASEIKGKNIVYLLNEDFGKPSKIVLDFLNYKHKRKELAGITKKSLEILFQDFKIINENEQYFLKAACTNSVENIENNIINNISKLDINIGSLGRLGKSYVPVMIDEIIKYAKINSNKQIQLILVGDSHDGKVEKEIIRKFQLINNLYVIFIGHIFPIPIKLFDKLDVCIGVAGSAKLCANNNVPTITLDVRSSKPIGILGYDTQNTIYGDQDQVYTLSEKLDDLIANYDYYKENINNMQVDLLDFRAEYRNHMKFINESDNRIDYYDLNVSINYINMEEILFKFLIFLFGTENFTKITKSNILIKIRKKLRNKYSHEKY